MKHLKAKLMGAVVMLLISALMLSTASYAWFTISTAPEISGMDTGMAANGNLEIALSTAADFATSPSAVTGADSTTQTGLNATWGNLVDLSSINDKITLRPVQFTTSSGAIESPKFGNDGRIDGFNTLTATFKKMSELNSEYTKDKAGVTVYYDNDGVAYAYRVDFFMRSNTAGDVKLTTTGVDRGTGTTGTGTSLSAINYKGLKVYFKTDSGDITKFYDGSDDSPAWDTSTAITSWDATSVNTTRQVSMYVVWEGADIDNTAFTNSDQDVKLNVQFTHSETLKALTSTSSAITTPADPS